MLKQTTVKLALSILGTSFIAVVLAFIILLTFGSIGAGSAGSASSAASGSSAVSSSAASSSAASGQGAPAAAGAATGLLGSLAGRIVLGGVCILIGAALIYSTAWREGNRDPNRVHYGHMRKFPAKGLVAGLLASIPYFLLWLAFLLSQSAAAGSSAAVVLEVVYRICNLQYVVLNDAVIRLPAACFVFLLPLPLFSAAGYLAGYRHFAILPLLMYKKSKGGPKAPTPGYTIKKAKGGDWTKK